MNTYKTISDTLKRISAALRELAVKIHENPETGFNEFKACEWQTELLEKLGFKVKTPFAGLKTAYFAEKGSGRPHVCFPAEFDALPGLGHACGHNLIAPASIGAAIILSELLEKEGIKGSVSVAGTPAEEGKGGKLYFISAGAFKSVDLAVMGHPEFTTSTWNGSLAVERFDVAFLGKSSHAAAAPHKGLNALDAVMLLFQGVNAWRQHILEDSRIHGIVTEGGDAPNIIPEKASCSFYLRASKNSVLKEMEERFRDIAKGAALMTGTKFRMTKGSDPYKSGIVLNSLNDEFLKIAEKMKIPASRAEKGGRGSSDFGDLSQVVPGIHYYFRAVEEKIHLHERAFAEKSANKYALDSLLKAAEISARIGYRFLKDEKFRKEVRTEFAKTNK